MTLSPVMLSNISKNISNGNWQWAMLTANEYLDKQHPMRLALKCRTITKLVKAGKLSREEKLILDGATMGEFSDQIRERVRNLARFQSPGRRAIPSKNIISRHMRIRSAVCTRKAVPQELTAQSPCAKQSPGDKRFEVL